MLAKPLHPFANGFPADEYAPLGEQILYICRAQRKPVVDPGSISDDCAGEPLAFEAEHLSWYLYNDRLYSTAGDDRLAMPIEPVSC